MKQNKSMVQAAYEIVSEHGKEMTFADLFAAIKKELEISDEIPLGKTESEADRRIGEFYTELTLDGRFVPLGNNTWDLRSRHTYEKVHIDVNDVYTDVDEFDDDKDEIREQEEYDAQIEGKKQSEDGDEPLEDEDEGESRPSENVADLL